MDALSQSAFLKALGWSLLNSIWQFGLLWLVFVLLVNNARKLSSSIRHGMALLLTSAGFIWFVAGLSFKYLAYSKAGSAFTPIIPDPLSWYASTLAATEKLVDANLPYLSGVYLLVVAAFFLQFFSQFYYSHTLATKGVTKITGSLQLHVLQLVQQMGIRCRVNVWASQHVDTPMVMGFITPTILIPLACINQLSVKQLEAILLHEIAHIKRNDYLINLYIATTDILFFFNPFSRMLVNAVRMERENSCDDWVLQFHFDPYQYASALLSLEKSRSSGHSLGIAAAGSQHHMLLNRIQRIMNVKQSDKLNGLKLTAYLLTIALLCLVALVNPGNAIMQKLVQPGTSFSNTSSSVQVTDRDFIRSIQFNRVPATVRKSIVKKRIDNTYYQPLPESLLAEEQPIAIEVAETSNEDAIQLVEAVAAEQRDYSIPDEKQPPLPLASMADPSVPFVPASSFSAFYTYDTTKPLKLESYSERKANESQVKVEKALEQLDWVKIQKLLNSNNADVVKLKKELTKSLKELNWQQINAEVQASLDKENSEKMRSQLKKEYENMSRYKAEQQEFQQLRTRLQEQQESYKKDADSKILELQKQVTIKKIVVHI